MVCSPLVGSSVHGILHLGSNGNQAEREWESGEVARGRSQEGRDYNKEMNVSPTLLVPGSPPTQAGQQGSLGAYWADPLLPQGAGDQGQVTGLASAEKDG